MKYYKVKQGLFWIFNDDGIFNYYTNDSLKNQICSSNDEELFQLLIALKEPSTFDKLSKLKFFSDEDLKNTLEFLLDHNYIEVSPSTTEVSILEKRLDNFIGAFPNSSYKEYKKKSSNIKTCLIGAGTAGSYIPEVYFKMGLDNLTLLDYDTVEEHNIIAQNFSIHDIGKNKLEVLVERYKKEFPDRNIRGINKKVQDFNHLKSIVNLEDYTYFLMYADDYELTVDILSNVFKYNKEIKIILSGYRVFSVESIVVDSENVETILKGLITDLKGYRSLKGVIVDNSGTILESYHIAFATMKIILDDLIGLNRTDYMMADLLKNSYFIGSQFEYMYNESRESIIKDNLYNFSEAEDTKVDANKNWINKLTVQNVRENNLIRLPELDLKAANYISFNNFSQETIDTFIEYKNFFSKDVQDYFVEKDLHKKKLFKLLMKYVQEFYPSNYYSFLKNLIDHGYIYTNSNKFGSKIPQAVSDGNHVYIYCEIDNSLMSFNNLLHEIFHALFFLNDNYDVYDHEEFVFSEQINFFAFAAEDEFISKLKESFMFLNIHMYLTNKITLDYEKFTLDKRINKFFQRWHDIENEELLIFLNENINQELPLKNLKYVSALEKNLASFLKMFEPRQSKDLIVN
ncbi:ThiF family adenylyltransferase [Planococcus sp. S3-L1]|uniref:ThiF family adenylyltransferase n=1 Tax=Planococcus sp. S3-L1 TaxID=3046200 RepID=UPI0024BB8F3A|nr:ThiF family adenylyltransferase [Planococcus sp. S3-L1]MDJ0333300.1 ThiF family adenylyltransferase [Planococcus sp. S3-L1]